jgi:hypothetical protein
MAATKETAHEVMDLGGSSEKLTLEWNRPGLEFDRQVCDQPHPLLVATIIQHCLGGNLTSAYDGMKALISNLD